MNCQDVREHFSALLDGHIGLTEQVPLEAHLRQCEACQQELEDLQTRERARPPFWRPNLAFLRKALEPTRPADAMERQRQRVLPRIRIVGRSRPRPSLFGTTLDVLRPADTTSPRRRSVHARHGTPWPPRPGVDLVRKALEMIRHIDIRSRLHRFVSSLRQLYRRSLEQLDVAKKALVRIGTLAAAVCSWRRVFLRVRYRPLRLAATVTLAALAGVGLFRYRAELDVAIRHWVPSAPSTSDAPPPTKMASTEPAIRPEIPPVSPPPTAVPAPPALYPSPVPPAPERSSEVTAPAEQPKGTAEPPELPPLPRRSPAPSPTVRDTRATGPAEPEVSKPVQVEQVPQEGKRSGARDDMVASAPPQNDTASEAAPASTPPVAGDARPSLDVVGRLLVKSRSGAERDLAALLAKAGGTTVSWQRGEKITVIEAVIPNPSYGKFAEGLTRIGSWQIEAGRSRLPDPVRVTMRLAE